MKRPAILLALTLALALFGCTGGLASAPNLSYEFTLRGADFEVVEGIAAVEFKVEALTKEVIDTALIHAYLTGPEQLTGSDKGDVWLPPPMSLSIPLLGDEDTATLSLVYSVRLQTVRFAMLANVDDEALLESVSGFDGWRLRIVIDP